MVMIVEVPSVCACISVSVNLFCVQQLHFSCDLLPNFHRMIVTKCRRAYCQAFAIRLFLKKLFPLVLIYALNLCTQLIHFSCDFYQTFEE